MIKVEQIKVENGFEMGAAVEDFVNRPTVGRIIDVSYVHQVTSINAYGGVNGIFYVIITYQEVE